MADNDQQMTHGRSTHEFSLTGFLWRVLFSLILVLATYNPSGLSYYDWAGEALSANEYGAVHFFIGVLLLVGWAILWVATWKALDTFGVALAAIVIAALVWLLIDLGLLDADSSTAIRWIGVASLALLLGIGLSWSHIWRRLTGQFEVDDD